MTVLVPRYRSPSSVAILSGITRFTDPVSTVPFHGRSPDVGLDAEAAVHDRAVLAVFHRHAGSNLYHRHGSPILTFLGVPVQLSGDSVRCSCLLALGFRLRAGLSLGCGCSPVPPGPQTLLCQWDRGGGGAGYCTSVHTRRGDVAGCAGFRRLRTRRRLGTLIQPGIGLAACTGLRPDHRRGVRLPHRRGRRVRDVCAGRRASSSRPFMVVT